jgi:hypothetical protein
MGTAAAPNRPAHPASREPGGGRPRTVERRGVSVPQGAGDSMVNTTSPLAVPE